MKPTKVTIVEVGPRDGLQNVEQTVPTRAKVAFIEALAEAGLPVVEATSFVNPTLVPQLADASEVMRTISRVKGVRYPALVGNLKGFDAALEAGAKEVAIFASATDTFSERNLGAPRAEALQKFSVVAKCAHEAKIKVRGYLSMVLGDPWEGDTDPKEAAQQAAKLADLGCFEVSLGDTIGTGTPGKVRDLIEAVRSQSDVPLAVHFHDTYGQGLANVLTALDCGIDVVDSAAGGLGGCPFAGSATGNLATEDLVYMLDGLGIETGVDIAKVAQASADICSVLGIQPPGRAARAFINRRTT